MYLSYYRNDSWEEGKTMKFINDADTSDRLHQPLVVLTSNFTVSAAEDFLIMLKGLGNRARIIGQKTAGTTGQILNFAIPTGGSYYICSKNDTYPDGRKFVGIGIIPDIEVEPTIEDYIKGEDKILEKAIQILKVN
jgi:carboxyl-terminal processing protease